jgi:hypothetical protein
VFEIVCEMERGGFALLGEVCGCFFEVTDGIFG